MPDCDDLAWAAVHDALDADGERRLRQKLADPATRPELLAALRFHRALGAAAEPVATPDLLRSIWAAVDAEADEVLDGLRGRLSSRRLCVPRRRRTTIRTWGLWSLAAAALVAIGIGLFAARQQAVDGWTGADGRPLAGTTMRASAAAMILRDQRGSVIELRPGAELALGADAADLDLRSGRLRARIVPGGAGLRLRAGVAQATIVGTDFDLLAGTQPELIVRSGRVRFGTDPAREAIADAGSWLVLDQADAPPHRRLLPDLLICYDGRDGLRPALWDPAMVHGAHDDTALAGDPRGLLIDESGDLAIVGQDAAVLGRGVTFSLLLVVGACHPEGHLPVAALEPATGAADVRLRVARDALPPGRETLVVWTIDAQGRQTGYVDGRLLGAVGPPVAWPPAPGWRLRLAGGHLRDLAARGGWNYRLHLVGVHAGALDARTVARMAATAR